MKIINSQKTIDYFGVELVVPDYGWLAVDEQGDVGWFEDEPETVNFFGYGEWSGAVESGYASLCKVDLEGIDWKETLMEIA